MDRLEAAQILEAYLSQYRITPYTDLVRLMDEVQVHEETGLSGTEYILEFDVVWDHEPNADIRVTGGIDDGKIRSALSPLCEDFILTPENEFVGE